MPSLTPDTFRFLRQLRRHNEKEWFEANRSRYEAGLRAPMRELVEEVDARLALAIPEIVGEPRKSLFRIHRDVRFSRDKSPYKTNAALWFYHRDAGRQVGSQGSGGAGFYFHLEPGACFLGGGLWMPGSDQLRLVREALVEDTAGFEAIVTDRAFRRRFGRLDEEAMLTRTPRGFAPDHPAARWLRFKSFTVGRELAEAEVLKPDLADRLVADYERLAPLVRWLNAALGFAPAAAR